MLLFCFRGGTGGGGDEVGGGGLWGQRLEV